VTQEERFEALRADIAARLRSVCKDWPDASFDELVERVAALALKYELDVTTGTYDRRATDRLVAAMRESLERSQNLRREDEGS
jgi:hypothetical protein